MLRGHVAEQTMSQAIDQLGSHLERQLHGFVDRRARVSRRSGEARPGEWHHGAGSPPRPSFHRRPVEERSIVRHKTFALGAIDPLQAVRDLLDLDHDFYLFHDTETDTDAVVYHRENHAIGSIYPDATLEPLPAEGPPCPTSHPSEPIVDGVTQIDTWRSRQQGAQRQ